MFHSCVDDDIPPKGNNGTDYGPYYLEEAKDYIHFKQGTWWVYLNSKTNERDSIVVSSSNLDTITLKGEKNTITQEESSFKATSYLNDFNYTMYLALRPFPDIWKGQHKNSEWAYTVSKSKPGDYEGESNVFVYPFGLNGGGSDHNTTYEGKLDSLLVQGILYRNVQTFIVSDDATFAHSFGIGKGGKTKYYWAPFVGMVKREHLTHNIKWELVNSHIIQ